MTGANRPPTGHQPGWYPDPWQGGRHRYWDGRRWTPMTGPNGPGPPPTAAPMAAPTAAAMAAAAPVGAAPPSAHARPRRIGRIFSLSVATFLLAVLVMAYALARGQEIKRVSPTGDIEFYSSGGGTEFSSEEIEQRQESMDQRLSELEQRARESGGSQPPSDAVDLSGTWEGANGLRYQIEQFGSEAVIQEISIYGVTATGYGEVDETGAAAFSYQAIDGSSGVADLELVSEDRLEGTFENHAYGTSMPAVLIR